jgi:ferredoxin, 2Fe-2S
VLHVICTDASGQRTTLEVRAGWSVMQSARNGGLAGIEGECGGMLACATCHCYVDAQWIARLPAPSEQELQMLENVAAERRPGSRLSCQLFVDEALDGLSIQLPDRQL